MLLQIGAVQRETAALLAHKLRNRDAARRYSIDGAPIEIYRQHTRGQVDGIARTHWS